VQNKLTDKLKMPSAVTKSSDSGSKKLILNHLLQEMNKYLNQLEKQHNALENDINKVFEGIIESLPQDIKNSSFAKVKDHYFKMIACAGNGIIENLKKADMMVIEKQVAAHDEEEHEGLAEADFRDETNLFDFASHLRNKDLTSTAKKTITCVKKIDTAKKKAIAVINEEDTVHYENDANDENDKNDSVPVKMFITVNIPLKDGQQKTVKISELMNLTLDQVHTDCVKEFKQIRESRTHN